LPAWITFIANTQIFTILSSTQGTGTLRNQIITVTATTTNPDNTVKTISS